MQTKEEIALQDALLNTYKYNLQFLSEYDNELFQRVSTLSDVIAQGIYPERYHLEFLKENKEFDIFDTNSNTYVYNKKPKKWNNKAIQSTNFDHNNTIALMNPFAYTQNITDISSEENNLMHINRLKIISEVNNYRNIRDEPLNNKSKKVKSFNKFIFVGTLLGRHIPKMIKKLNTINHFVCESNLEIFRLSLFTCDYSLLARDGKSVVFSIMDDDVAFTRKFEQFFMNHITQNTVYKYYSTNYNLENYFDRILSITLNRDPLNFNYKLILDNMVNESTKNFNKYNTFDFSKKSDFKLFKEHNILFIGAGPSLSKNIKWLEENQDKFIIVAMAAALKKLNIHNIKPDIITTLDPQDDIVYDQFSSTTKDTLNSAIKIASLNTPQKVFDLFNQNKESVYTYEVLKSFQEGSVAIDGFTIGEVTFKLLLLLKASNIYLLGIDLALDQKTGKTHIDTHSGNRHTYEVDTNKEANLSMFNKKFSLKDETIVIKGNQVEKVSTTRMFAISLIAYNHSMRFFKETHQSIYNLSRNGAYIDETISMSIDDLDLSSISNIDKSAMHLSIKDELQYITVKQLSKNNIDNINNEIIQLNDAISFIKSTLINKVNTYSKFQEFTKDINNILLNIGTGHSFIPEIYINFYFIINRYIDFVFNTRESRDDSKDIREIHYVWSNHIITIIQDYIKYIKRLVK